MIYGDVFRHIIFLVLFVFKALNESAPSCIGDLLKGHQAFAVEVLRLWNGLPLDIRTSHPIDAFKSGLKAYFYLLAFVSVN